MSVTMMKVIAIAHKREKGAAVTELDRAEITTESGVENDLAGAPGKRQVTLLSKSQWQEACAELGQEISWTVRRANILLDGVVFGPEQVGNIIKIGTVRLEVTKETVPCQLMDDQVPGLRKALTPDWRGGVCCRVVQSGQVEIGDSGSWLE